jgi:hypothetical protein
MVVLRPRRKTVLGYLYASTLCSRISDGTYDGRRWPRAKQNTYDARGCPAHDGPFLVSTIPRIKTCLLLYLFSSLVSTSRTPFVYSKTTPVRLVHRVSEKAKLGCNSTCGLSIYSVHYSKLATRIRYELVWCSTSLLNSQTRRQNMEGCVQAA